MANSETGQVITLPTDGVSRNGSGTAQQCGRVGIFIESLSEMKSFSFTGIRALKLLVAL